jgi:hypothetical protein
LVVYEKDDVLFLLDAARAVLSTCSNAMQQARIRSSWALANILDLFADHADGGELFDQLDRYRQILDVGIQAAQDNDKLRPNGVRIIGTVLCLKRDGFTHDMDMVDKAVLLMCHHVGTGSFKLRWNACHAFGKMLRNSNFPIGTALWTAQVYECLLAAVAEKKNFKVRIHALVALASPSRVEQYGGWKERILNQIQSTRALDASIVKQDEEIYKEQLEKQMAACIQHLNSL